MSRIHDLGERRTRLSGMRNSRVVHQHVETAEFAGDPIGCGGDGALIRHVELKGVGVRADGLGGSLPSLQVPRPQEHGEPLRREILSDGETNALVGPGDNGDALVLHGDVQCQCVVRTARMR
jgi:hypothetical protein